MKKTLDNTVLRTTQSNNKGHFLAMRLILASGSRYRRDMLSRLGLPFTTHSPDIDESPLPEETPSALALRLAELKAGKVSSLYPDAIVIGSDQVATFNGTIIGKPGTHEAAFLQLQTLSDKQVQFHSALCVRNGLESRSENVITHCHFRKLSQAEIQYYLQREQPYDTAGSAKAESLGIALMQSMRSDDPSAIIGLPLIALCSMLRYFGVNPLHPFINDTSEKQEPPCPQ